MCACPGSGPLVPRVKSRCESDRSKQIFDRSTGVDAVWAVEGVVQHGVGGDSQRVVHRGDEVVRRGRFVGGIEKPGTVTVPGGGKQGNDISPGTLNSILKQAGMK